MPIVIDFAGNVKYNRFMAMHAGAPPQGQATAAAHIFPAGSAPRPRVLYFPAGEHLPTLRRSMPSAARVCHACGRAKRV